MLTAPTAPNAASATSRASQRAPGKNATQNHTCATRNATSPGTNRSCGSISNTSPASENTSPTATAIRYRADCAGAARTASHRISTVVSGLHT